MLIYIIHSDKIYDFRLSNNVSGKYILTDYDQFGVKRNLVNIEAKDNEWFMFQNKNVKISYKDQRFDSISLKPRSFYTLTILGKENVIIYTMPTYDNTFKMYELFDDIEFTIGGDPSSDLKVDLGYPADLIKISFKDRQYKYETLNNFNSLYINKQQSNKGYINNFDTLFILGLKIVFINNKILINNPNNQQLILSNEKFTDVKDVTIVKNKPTDVRSFSDFYEESEYYFKSPVFKPQIKEADIEIEDPPSKDEKDKSSVLMSVIPSVVMTLTSVLSAYSTIQKYKSGESTKEDLINALLVVGGLILTSILWPFVERFVSNLRIMLKNKKSKKIYLKYLEEKNKELDEINREQKMILATNNLSYTNCAAVINARSSELFSRNIDTEDFLNICLGIGNVPLKAHIEYSKPRYTQVKDALYIKVKNMVEKYKTLEEVPYVVSLKEKNVIAFILECRELYKEYMQGIFLQLMTLQSYIDLKLVVLTSSENTEISYLKDSNFCWDDEHEFRYFATTLEEAQQISTRLERELNQRKTKKEDNTDYGEYYLIVSDSISLYRNLNIVNDIINDEKNYNFGLLMYDLKTSNIPNECLNFVNISRNEGAIFKTNDANNDLNRFKPTLVVDEKIDVDKYSRLISNIPIKTIQNKASAIPNSFGFLQMYSVGNIDQLNIPAKWDETNPSISLAVPIGIDGNQNLIYLDLHEKNHGPHGLVAGMTGSGKSELIITYILSLAVNFRPDEVQFVLIDYKGGGLAGAFENRKTHIKLPHLVGTITNLDKSEMKRTLVSINSELQRRQRKFNSVKETLNTGSIDIYKYQKLHRDGVIKEPMSHLFIICDEFAELKAQQPEFMDELVSAARIGRSLGIHLILATQKPSGVVDDQIWSNSKFKICCRVQTEGDSNEMIKKPDAAFLKNAGSFFLQVGVDEYFVQGQSAYSGNPYVPSNRISTQIDNDIVFINNSGEAYKTIVSDVEEVNTGKDLGEEFTNVLSAIIKESEKRNYKYNQLWLDNIPTVIYYNNIIKKYGITEKQFNLTPTIGEYDDPKNQKQGYVSLPITTGGNTYICGKTGSGKNTLISSIIYSTITNHNCNEVNIYIVDLGSEKLRKFQSAPQVGDVLTIADTNKIKYLFYSLETEKTKRQKYYSNNNSDFITDATNGKAVFPNILVVIYDVDVFREAFEDLYDEQMPKFTRNCSKYGINFVITGNSTSSLGYTVDNNFPQKIMLNMTDQSEYTMNFPNCPIPNTNPGRGLVKLDDVYEFQVPLIFDDSQEEEGLNYILEQLNKFLKNPAPKVPTVPEEVIATALAKYKTDLTSVPLGINVATAQIGYYNFDSKITLTSSTTMKSIINFFRGVINFMITYPNTNIIVLNGLKDGKMDLDEKVKVYSSGFKDVLEVISKNVDKYNETPDDTKKFVIFILGYSKIFKHLSEDEESENIDNIVLKTKNNSFKFVLFDSPTSYSSSSNNDIFNIADSYNGIWIGSDFDNQEFFEPEDKYSIDDIRQGKDTAILIKNNQSEVIKFIK